MRNLRSTTKVSVRARDNEVRARDNEVDVDGLQIEAFREETKVPLMRGLPH